MPDDDDDAAMRLSLGELNEVVLVTRDQEAVMFMRELQDERIGSVFWEHITHAGEFVAEFLE